jgi:hypothetical protein
MIESSDFFDVHDFFDLLCGNEVKVIPSWER